MRGETNPNISSWHSSFLTGFNCTPSSLPARPLSGTGGQGRGLQSIPHVFSATASSTGGKFFPCSSRRSLPWQTSPTLILPMSCSSSLPALVWVIFHFVKSSRSSPFQHGSPMESQVLSANLL